MPEALSGRMREELTSLPYLEIDLDLQKNCPGWQRVDDREYGVERRGPVGEGSVERERRERTKHRQVPDSIVYQPSTLASVVFKMLSTSRESVCHEPTSRERVRWKC